MDRCLSLTQHAAYENRVWVNTCNTVQSFHYGWPQLIGWQGKEGKFFKQFQWYATMTETGLEMMQTTALKQGSRQCRPLPEIGLETMQITAWNRAYDDADHCCWLWLALYNMLGGHHLNVHGVSSHVCSLCKVQHAPAVITPKLLLPHMEISDYHTWKFPIPQTSWLVCPCVAVEITHERALL